MMADVPYSRDAEGIRHEWTTKEFDAHLDTLSKRAEVLLTKVAEDAYQNDRTARKAEILNKIVSILENLQDEEVADLVKLAGVEENIQNELLRLVEQARAI